MSIKHLIR